MQSRIAAAIGLSNNPVALTWSSQAPDSALHFRTGSWGCVVSLIAAVAAKGSVAAFSRQTYGCWGGGVGLGFGNQYEVFPGGVEGFCRFLSDGNSKTELGRAIGTKLQSGGGASLADDFLNGERYVKDPSCVEKFLDSMPMRDLGEKFVVFKPLSQVDPAADVVKNITFFVEPDALSALVVLANYKKPNIENVGMPWAAGCQVIGIYSYQELDRENPRALVGLTDISARKSVRRTLGKHVMSFTAPWKMFLEMESNVDDSFFQRETWKALQRP
ncbi:MAG TPA: DUF169 domain-containing protein [Terriglobales bacterium]|nr:DUF169 domain-containing protein [Terriglobales bacterium]